MNRQPVLAFALLAVLVIFPGQVCGQCPKHVYYLSEGYSFQEGNLVFNYLDMDADEGGVQAAAVTRPGEYATVELSWTWGQPCPECTVSISAWGDWSQVELARVYSGRKGGFPRTAVVPISFKVPDEPGEYRFRVIFAYDPDYSGDFHASAGCSPEACEAWGGCYLLVAEGRLNVTNQIPEGRPPLVRITSPVPSSISGIAQLNHSAVVTINVRVDDPDANVSVFVDGQKIGGGVPLRWDTGSYALGRHELVVVARSPGGQTGSDTMTVVLTNATPLGQPPQPAWSVTFAQGIRDYDMTADRIAVAAGEKIILLDMQGRVVWEYRSPFPVDDVELQEGGGSVLAAGGRVLYLLDAAGELLWNRSQGTGIDGMAFSGDSIAVRSGSNLYLLNDNGTLQWSATATGLEGLCLLAPDRIVSGSRDEVYLFRNGTLQWTYPTADVGKILVHGGTIFVKAGERIVFLNESGTLEGSLETGNITDFAVSGGELLVLGDGSITAYTPSGELLWRWPVDGGEALAASGSAVAYLKDGGIYVLAPPGPEVEPAREITRELAAILGGGFLFLVILAVAVWRMRRRPEEKEEEGPAVVPPAGPVEEGTGARPPGPEVTESRVMVRVKNARNGKPVAGARVSLGEEVKVTDERGRAVFARVPVGNYRLRVEEPSYRSMEKQGVLRWEEEFIDVEMAPAVTSTGMDFQPRIQGIADSLEASYEKAAVYDRCIPGFLRGIGRDFIELVREVTYSPELYSGDRARLEEVLDVLEGICRGLGEVMTDWKNMRLYQASLELGDADNECRGRKVRAGEGLGEVFADPGAYISKNYPRLEREISELDAAINSRMKELTILPVANLWKLSREHLTDAQEGGVRGAFSLFAAEVLSEKVREMLEKEDVLRRLGFSLL
ncbi:MAG: PQQ-binding-like beta-propeller repeat protein [Euryarchaeota archaeon]|nr:PQQ-binding-like beta-propeller repeat protein [Euryarchaeota archaeon]